ncbi:hypothetical protein B0H13DRAFT_2437581 [Mycena leptocephala]|nr:hypothetical protein B0H13DRAFT_2437581 [Mycena leptocephala]
MAHENESPAPARQQGRGSNNQRAPAAQGASKQNTGGRKPKNKNTQQSELEAELERVRAELAATKASINERAARGSAPGEDAEPIQRLERPKGEAGDGKNGFNLQNAMGLEDDDEQYQAIMRSVHHNVVRANVDFTVDFRRQDPARLAAVYKLTRETHKPFLSRERFPLDWAIAEMTKQFLRNKRKHAVRRGYIGNREERKREREESAAEGSNKRRKTSTPTTHIDDMATGDEDENDD